MLIVGVMMRPGQVVKQRRLNDSDDQWPGEIGGGPVMCCAAVPGPGGGSVPGGAMPGKRRSDDEARQ